MFVGGVARGSRDNSHEVRPKTLETRPPPDYSSNLRYRPKGVFGKGVGNSKNASEMRQKYVRNASKMRQNFWEKGNASEMRQNRVRNAQNTFDGEHLLDDTEICVRLKHLLYDFLGRVLDLLPAAFLV